MAAFGYFVKVLKTGSLDCKTKRGICCFSLKVGLSCPYTGQGVPPTPWDPSPSGRGRRGELVGDPVQEQHPPTRSPSHPPVQRGASAPTAHFPLLRRLIAG